LSFPEGKDALLQTVVDGRSNGRELASSMPMTALKLNLKGLAAHAIGGVDLTSSYKCR
jgi:hypothetical protein